MTDADKIKQLEIKIEQEYINPLYDILKDVSKKPEIRVSAYHQLSKIDDLVHNLKNTPQSIENIDDKISKILADAKIIFNDRTDKSDSFDEHENDLMEALRKTPNMEFDETFEGGKRKRSNKRSNKRSVNRSNKRSNKRSVKRGSIKHNRTSYSPNGIVATLTEMLHAIKLHHWRTHDYSVHKATDNLHEALSEQVDSFVEKLLGSKQTRSNLTSLRMNAYNTLPALKRRVEHYKRYLRGMPASLGTDLLNIRDELLGSLNQFSYMLSLH
jgi:DNA-binding ferritin-like protein